MKHLVDVFVRGSTVHEMNCTVKHATLESSQKYSMIGEDFGVEFNISILVSMHVSIQSMVYKRYHLDYVDRSISN